MPTSNFLGLFVFCLLTTGTASPTVAATSEGETLVDRIEAVVGKKIIFHSALSEFRSSMGQKEKIDPLFSLSQLAMRKDSATNNEILKVLIQEALILEKFPTADADVESRIRDFEGRLKIDRTMLKDLLAREGLSYKDYFEIMRVAIAKDTLVARELRSKAVVSDEEVRGEYYTRASAKGDTFRGTIRLMLLSEPKASFKSAEAAKSYFDSEARLLRDKIQSPNWIDLGYISFREIAPSILAETKKLKIGEFSSIIEDGQNYKIVHVVDIKTDEDPEFNDIKEQLRAQMMQVEIQRQLDLWTERQKTSVPIRLTAEPTKS